MGGCDLSPSEFLEAVAEPYSSKPRPRLRACHQGEIVCSEILLDGISASEKATVLVCASRTAMLHS